MPTVVAILAKEEEVINIANIQSRLGNSFRITGISNPTEARQLSLLLRAGALIAPIQVLKNGLSARPGYAEHQTGPGSVSGRSGGLYPVHDLLLQEVRPDRDLGAGGNLVLIVGIMSLIPGATLTMPGLRDCVNLAVVGRCERSD